MVAAPDGGKDIKVLAHLVSPTSEFFVCLFCLLCCLNRVAIRCAGIGAPLWAHPHHPQNAAPLFTHGICCRRRRMSWRWLDRAAECGTSAHEAQPPACTTPAAALCPFKPNPPGAPGRAGSVERMHACMRAQARLPATPHVTVFDHKLAFLPSEFFRPLCASGTHRLVIQPDARACKIL